VVVVAVSRVVSGQIPLLFHGCFLLQVAVVRHVTDNFGIGFNPQRLRIVGHLSELALVLLKGGVVLDL